MIPYDFGYWGIRFIFKKSDVFWRAGVMGLMSGAAAFVLRLAITYTKMSSNVDEFQGLTSLWGGWTFVLSFLLVFRTQVAYSRYTEGIGLLQQTFGVWLNATSNLLAFSSVDRAATPEEVKAAMRFRHLLVRLMSLLNVTALQDVAIMNDENFSVIDVRDLGRDSLKFLNQSDDKLEIVMQWVQNLICANHKSGVIWIPAPILSRVFQELSNGVVFVHDAMKITEFPFPFPYAQMTTIMLIAYSCSLPIVFAFSLNSPYTAGLLAFLIVFSQWGMNYIAAEIEMPFGDDPNDIEIRSIGELFNHKLKSLMDPLSSKIPDFEYEPSKHDGLPVELMYDCSPDGYVTGRGLKDQKRRYASRVNDETRASAQNESQAYNLEIAMPKEIGLPSKQGALEEEPWCSIKAEQTEETTAKDSAESSNGYFDEFRASAVRTPNADSFGTQRADSLSTANVESLDTFNANSAGPLTRLRANKQLENGTPLVQPGYGEIFEISRGEDTSSLCSPCEGLVEHI